MMCCSICGTPMTEERDPYATGSWWYVLYEPNCNCPDGETSPLSETEEEDDER